MVLPEGMDAASWVAHQTRLLGFEADAEVAEASTASEKGEGDVGRLVDKGHAVSRLVVADVSTGLMGRTLVTLRPRLGADLPAHKLGPGDIVGLRPGKVSGGSGDPKVSGDEVVASTSSSSSLSSSSSVGGMIFASGLVYRCYADRIVVALEEVPEEGLPGGDASVIVVKLANEASSKRMREALSHALALDGRYSACRAVADVCFGRTGVSCVSLGEAEAEVSRLESRLGVGSVGRGLNSRQRAAVGVCMASRDVAIVHGPPGTGKTTTICEVLRVAAVSGLKVLATAPSNVAVDNMVERVAGLKGVRAVRLGHPARLLPSVLSVSLDALVGKSDAASLAKDIEKEMAAINKQLAGWGDKKKGKKKVQRDADGASSRKELRTEMRALRKELRERERGAVDEILGAANVVFATCTGAGAKDLNRWLEKRGGAFDLVVVDEAAMALEAATWVPLVLGKRCVLAGDHCQLPPVVKSKKAENEGLAVTLFERLALGEETKGCAFMLETQYRMHADICEWPSRELYEGRLVADASVSGHLLRGLRMGSVRDCDFTASPLVLVDTDGCDGCEEGGGTGESKRNEGEARVVEMLVRSCLASVSQGGLGLEAEDIGIITPYNAQVDILREKMLDLRGGESRTLEIGSVDGFQGREKELIILSLVRSNDKPSSTGKGDGGNNGIGFLAEDRRINVAVTRARRCCAVVCDAQTVGRHAFLGRMIDHFNAKGEYHSADEFILGDEENAASILGVTTDKSEDECQEAHAGRAVKSVGEVEPPSTSLTFSPPVDTPRPRASPSVPPARDGEKREKPEKPKRVSMTREEVQAKIEGFLARAEGKEELGFSPHLSTYERMLVHDVCEELGVAHVSRGKDKQRRVFVLNGVPVRRPTEVEAKGAEAKGDPKVMAALAAEKRLAAMRGTPLDHVTPPAPAPRIDISAVLGVDEGDQVESDGDDEKDVGGARPGGSQIQSKGSKRKNKKKKPSGPKQTEALAALPDTGDDIDALLEELAVSNKYCGFKLGASKKVCGKPTGMIGATCDVCRLRFCLEHGVPETHGCGAGIRQLERAKHLHAHAVQGKGQSDLKPWQRKSLVGQLKAKVTGLVAGRSKAKEDDGADRGKSRRR